MVIGFKQEIINLSNRLERVAYMNIAFSHPTLSFRGHLVSGILNSWNLGFPESDA